MFVPNIYTITLARLSGLNIENLHIVYILIVVCLIHSHIFQNNKIEQQMIISTIWCLFYQNLSRNYKVIEVNVLITLLKGDQSGLTFYK